MLSYISHLWYGNPEINEYINEERKSNASLIIQSNYKRHYERKIYKNKLKKIRKIQRWWRKISYDIMLYNISENIVINVLNQCKKDLIFEKKVNKISNLPKFRVKNDWEIEWEKARELELAEDRRVFGLYDASCTSNSQILDSDINTNVVFTTDDNDNNINNNNINYNNNYNNKSITGDNKNIFGNNGTLNNILGSGFNTFKRSYSNNDIRINVDLGEELNNKFDKYYKNIKYTDYGSSWDKKDDKYKTDEIDNIIWNKNKSIFEGFSNNKYSQAFNYCGVIDIDAYRRDFKLYIDNNYDPKYLEKYENNFEYELDCMDFMRKCMKNLGNNINDMVSKCRKSIEQEINREPEYDEETQHLLSYI